MKEMRNAYKIMVGKLEGKRPFGIPRCRMILEKYGGKL
jgi:hypothetical protein